MASRGRRAATQEAQAPGRVGGRQGRWSCQCKVAGHTREPLEVVAEVVNWRRHNPEAVEAMRDDLERLNGLGVEHIEDRKHTRDADSPFHVRVVPPRVPVAARPGSAS